MNIGELILIGLSLSMDAFSISIYKGLQNKNNKVGIITTLFFSSFQSLMPILGYYFGHFLSERIINYHSYFSSILLIIIGVLMIKDQKFSETNTNLDYKELIILSIATSIDAFVVGISFSFIKTKIILASIIIGIITFIITNIGYYLGSLLHEKCHQYTKVIGGITLIIIGIKLLFNQV